jgi:hypothetical protein
VLTHSISRDHLGNLDIHNHLAIRLPFLFSQGLCQRRARREPRLPSVRQGHTPPPSVNGTYEKQ